MRRLVIGLVLLGIVTGGAIWLVHYLTTGSVSITTNNPNTLITLTKVPGDDDDDASASKTFSTQAHGQLSLTLKTGRYVASVQYNSIAATQAIVLEAHQHLAYELNAPTASSVEPVAYQAASDLAANATLLRFVDPTSEGLYQIDASNTSTRLDSQINFQQVQWADATYGIGQDTNGRFYVINNGVAQAIDQAPLTSQVSRYSVAPNKELYFANGSTIYVGTPTTGFKKIYTDSKPFTSLLATNGKVAIINSPVDGGPATTPYVVVVDDSGKSFKKSVEMPPSAAWSPNGAFLASTDVDDNDGMEIYDSSLQKVVQIPGPNMDNATWMSNDTLAYSVNDEIWTYSFATQRANLLANMPLGAGVVNLTLSDDKSYLYASTLDDSNDYALKRVGLKGQTVPEMITQLQDILPEDLGNYALSLVNFTQPVIVIQPNPDSGPQNDVAAAQTTLQQDGFDISKLGFEQLPSQSGE